MATPVRHQRGVTLVEALIGFLVLSLGVLGAAQLQSWLRLNGDTARQRSEAVRLAQQDMEQVRGFADITAFNRIVAHQATPSETPTRFTLVRNVTNAPDAALKSSSVSVSWSDRSGSTQTVRLHSSLAGTLPVVSAALTLPSQDQVIAPRRRLPWRAKMLGDGRSVLKPSESSNLAWLVSDATGLVSAQCSVSADLLTHAITEADLSACSAVAGSLLGGYIRFSLGAQPDAAHPDDTPLALRLNLVLSPDSATPPRCDTDTAAGGAERYTAYTCFIPRATGDTGWSGQLQIVPIGWTIGETASSYKICRYSADHDGSGRIDRNDEHPERYTDVQGPLMQQNHLVIRGDAACPGAIAPHNGASVATVQQQP